MFVYVRKRQQVRINIFYALFITNSKIANKYSTKKMQPEITELYNFRTDFKIYCQID